MHTTANREENKKEITFAQCVFFLFLMADKREGSAFKDRFKEGISAEQATDDRAQDNLSLRKNKREAKLNRLRDYKGSDMSDRVDKSFQKQATDELGAAAIGET